jgi:hypothetical protein
MRFAQAAINKHAFNLKKRKKKNPLVSDLYLSAGEF